MQAGIKYLIAGTLLAMVIWATCDLLGDRQSHLLNAAAIAAAFDQGNPPQAVTLAQIVQPGVVSACVVPPYYDPAFHEASAADLMSQLSGDTSNDGVIWLAGFDAERRLIDEEALSRRNYDLKGTGALCDDVAKLVLRRSQTRPDQPLLFQQD